MRQRQAKTPSMLAGMLGTGANEKVYQSLNSFAQVSPRRFSAWVCVGESVSGMDNFDRARRPLSDIQKARYCLKRRILALLPVALKYLARLAVQVKPLEARLEKRTAFVQLRLASLSVVMPGDGFRA